MPLLRSLFLKIFVWFSAAMLTMIVSTFLVVELARPLPFRRPHQLAYDHILHMAAMFLIGAAFCYWLAKYLTAPVTKLRKATNELAAEILQLA